MQRSWYGLDRIVSAAESLREFARENCLLPACRSFRNLFYRAPATLSGTLSRCQLKYRAPESPLLEEWLSAQRHDLGLTERSIRLREQNVPNYSL